MKHVETQKELNQWIVATLALCTLLVGVALFVLPQALGWSQTTREMSQQLGSVLATSVVTGLIYDFVLRKKFLREVELRFDEGLERHDTLNRSAADAGLDAVHPRLPEQILLTAIDGATRHVSILQSWIPNSISLAPHLYAAAARGVEIRILILDPQSRFLDERKAQLKSAATGTTVNEVNSTIDGLSTLLDSPPSGSRVFVRFYDEMPLVAVHEADDQLFVGFMWRQTGSISAPQLAIDGRAGYFGRCVRAHVRAVWDRAREFKPAPAASAPTDSPVP